MAIDRWHPRQGTTKQEEVLLRRLRKGRKLFAFLRDYRHELFDDGFQAELESMYRGTGAGKEPTPPALLAMALLLQSYDGASDAEAVELMVVDLRWQMVLDRLGKDEARPRPSQRPIHRRRPARAAEIADFRARLLHALLHAPRIPKESAAMRGGGAGSRTRRRENLNYQQVRRFAQ
ncbi:MAG TPA: transposase [Polyangia bacterium]|nr:transposase [Polyangia bacterium]